MSQDKKFDLGYEHPEYPRGGCRPMTIAFYVAGALFAAAYFVAMWWFTTVGV